MDRSARLLSLFDQRIALASAQAVREERKAAEAADAAQRLRSDVDRGLATLGLGPETDLSRADLYGRLRSLALRRAHFAEAALEASVQEAAADDATRRQAEAAARAAEARRKAQKIQRWMEGERRQRRLLDLATQSNDIEESFACRHR